MTDLDLPPDSPLPDGVRAAALTRLAAPPPRCLPLRVAAAAVAVVAATTLAVLLTDGGDSGPATAPTPAEHPELRHRDPVSYYDLRTGSAADGAEHRCRARTTTAERWTPIATASRHRVALTAFETPAGIVFCETTPLSVTVSSPQADPGALAVAFTTAGGYGRRVDGGVQRLRSPFVPARRTPGAEPGRPRGAGRPRDAGWASASPTSPRRSSTPPRGGRDGRPTSPRPSCGSSPGTRPGTCWRNSRTGTETVIRSRQNG